MQVMPVSKDLLAPWGQASPILGLESSMTSPNDLAWWQKTIAYEVYPKSFYDTAAQGTGTIAGITAKLDYLQALGVGAVWITPCYKSPMVDNGYDVADYYAIDPSFGTMEQMDELIAKGTVTLSAKAREDLYKQAESLTASLKDVKWTRTIVQYDPDSFLFTQTYTITKK